MLGGTFLVTDSAAVSSIKYLKCIAFMYIMYHSNQSISADKTLIIQALLPWSFQPAKKALLSSSIY